MAKTLNENQQKFLLELARQAIEIYLTNGEKPEVTSEDEILTEERGAFVSLKVSDQLRGCIGYLLPSEPLYKTVIDVAIAAATQDYRFLSLTKDDLKDTRIEISVLCLPEPVKDVNEIEIGKHGIIITKGNKQGLLLPQVPVEQNWDLKTFLKHGCLKAGLPENEWKKKAKIEIFSAQVFSE